MTDLIIKSLRERSLSLKRWLAIIENTPESDPKYKSLMVCAEDCLSDVRRQFRLLKELGK